MFSSSQKIRMPEPGQVLPGRDVVMTINNRHYVNGNHLQPPFPDSTRMAPVWPWLFLGRRTQVLGASGCLQYRCGICRGYDA